MTSDCTVYSSVQLQNIPQQQITNLVLSGISTNDETLNSDDGLLYGSFTFSSPTYTLSLYSDAARSQLVGTATASALGQATITESNLSGLSGTVNFNAYSADDLNIKLVCFLSKDANLPLNNLENLGDYDPIVGYARFHLEAFEEIKRYLISRDGSLLWNPGWVDINQINNGVGGYDLSRILNWQARELIDASAHYAFFKLAEKQAIDPDSIFAKRSCASRQIYKGILSEFDVQFDENNQRVVSKTRTLSSWRVSRA